MWEVHSLPLINQSRPIMFLQLIQHVVRICLVVRGNLNININIKILSNLHDMISHLLSEGLELVVVD